eukprot:768545-Hanusia_phi.AAC.1
MSNHIQTPPGLIIVRSIPSIPAATTDFLLPGIGALAISDPFGFGPLNTRYRLPGPAHRA